MAMTVFHLLPDLHVGGILRLVQYNATTLQQSDNEIRNIVVYFNDNQDGRYLFENAGIEVIHVPYKGFLSAVAVAFRLRKLVKEYAAGIVHSHLPFDCRFSWALSFLTGVSVVMTLHFIWDRKGGTLRGTQAERINKWFFFQCMQRAKRIIAVSEFVKSFYPEKLQRKIEVIYSGVPDSSGVPSNFSFQGNPKLVCVGRSHFVKGHAFLIDLAIILKPRLPDLKIYIYTKNPGQSEYGQSMLRRVQAENLSDQIVFVEDVNDPLIQVGLYRSADCFVFPSVYESLPLSILEAFSFGLPVVASDVGGIPEAVRPGYNGYLFQVGDMRQAAECLVQLCHNTGLRNTLSANARTSYERNFSVRISGERLLEFYRSVSNR